MNLHFSKSPEPDDPQRMHRPHKRPGRIYLIPFLGEIGIIRYFMMIVLEQFPHHEEVKRKTVLAMILIVEIGITIFVPAPVDDSAMDGTHKIMDRQQQVHPPMRGKCDIKSSIPDGKSDPGHPEITDPVDHRPGGIITPESRLRLLFIQEIIHVDILRLHRHMPDILKEVRRVRVLFRIAVRMMHTMQDSVCPGIQERRTLGNESEAVKESLPKLIHLEHLMRTISMQEECLRK